MADQFSLCWNNFHSNLSNGFHSLYQSEDFVDVTLAAEGQYLKAHKMVLSVCSEYFKELFQVNPCKHPIVILKDVGYNSLRDLLQFMYLGEVSVSQEELGNLMKVAELLQVKGLTEENVDTPHQNGLKTNSLHLNDSKLSESRSFLKRPNKSSKKSIKDLPAKIPRSDFSLHGDSRESSTASPTGSNLEDSRVTDLMVTDPQVNDAALTASLGVSGAIGSRRAMELLKVIDPQKMNPLMKPKGMSSRVLDPKIAEPAAMDTSGLEPPRVDSKEAAELVVEPELVVVPLKPKEEPADEPTDPSESGEYSEHSLPEMDVSSMLDTSLGEPSAQGSISWKSETPKVCRPSDTNTAGMLMFTRSRKGMPHLIYDSNLFRPSGKIGNMGGIIHKYWECVQNRKTGCKARCMFINGGIELKCREHNHYPPVDYIQQREKLGAVYFMSLNGEQYNTL